MKGVKILISLITFSVFLTSGFVSGPTTEAYNNTVTHPLLTQKIAELYNAIYEPDLADDEIQSLMAGSTDEDTPPRWINHFYDPTTGLGWSGERLGSISSVDVLTAAISAFNKNPESAVTWVQDQELQNSDYFLYQGDRTLNSAVLYSLEGKDQEAYYSLGYVLHLIEDMTVPAHTRQDTHVDLSSLDFFSTFLGVKFDGGEPYEKWAQENGEIGQDTMDYLKDNYQPICSSLENCLTYLAKYSNSNFFSEDSIIDNNYKLPIASNYIYKDKYIYLYNKENILLSRAKIEDKTNILYDKTTNLDNINQTYWDRLSPAAILAGVEVVKYFKDQVKKAENKEITLERPKKIGFLDKIKTLSPYGEVARAGKYLAAIFTNPFLGWGYDEQQGDDQPKTQSPNLLTDLEITPENAQDRMDDLQELIDLLNGNKENVNPFTPPSFELPSLLVIEPPSLEQPDLGLELESPQLDSIELPLIEPPELLQTQTPIIVTYSGGGGGGSSTVYPKILISEIQILPIAQRFVELYNPNDQEVNLTGWYIQRKTSTSTSWNSFVSSTKFEGKVIPAKGYFLISREIGNSNIISDITLSDNNSLILKNPNREASDMLGFGQAPDFEGIATQNPISGKALGRKWGNSTEQDTGNNFADFEEQNPTPKSQNITPSISTPTPPEPEEPIPTPTPIDNKAPTVIFNLPTEQQNLIFDVAFNITDLSVENVSPSGLQAFQFRWKEGEEGDWQEDALVDIVGAPASYDATRSFTGVDETTYYFQVKAKDLNNNESEWLPEDSVSTWVRTPKTILINEIQIDSVVGTGGTDDDWVELYNPYDVEVSLKGWSIQKHSKSDPCGVDSSFSKKNFSNNELGIFTIPAKGYYLIVDTEANAGLQAKADMTISWTLSDNNTIYLVRNEGKIENGDNPDIIDKVGFGLSACFPEGSAAPKPLEAESIERMPTGIDTGNNANDFKVSTTPTPKTDITIQDITNYTMSEGSGSPGTQYYFIKLKWQSASNVSFYQVQYNKNDVGWQDWLLQTTDTEKTYIFPLNFLINRNVISFRVRAQDTDGNLGNWAQIDTDLSNSIVINELAAFGTDAEPGVEGQWIELYNKGDSPVDLTGWKLVSGYGGYGNWLDFTLQGTIQPKGYFLLERGDDGVILDITANQVYSGSAGANGYFYLVAPNGRTVDRRQMILDNVPEGTYMKDGHYYSLERVSAYGFGNEAENWKLNDGVIVNGLDRDGGQIYGTPGQPNSVNQLYTPVYNDFVEDTILSKSLSPYFFHHHAVTVFEDTALTIEPGVTLKFSNSSGMFVAGTLKVIGTPEEPIIFASMSDTPVPGSWLGIRFTDKSKDSKLENVKMSYAGYIYGDSQFYGFGIMVDRSSITIKDSLISNNARQGLRLVNSSSTVDGLTVSDNMGGNPGEALAGSGISIYGGSPTIKNSFILRNYFGVYMNDYWSEGGLPAVPATPILENLYYEGNTNDIWPLPLPPPPI